MGDLRSLRGAHIAVSVVGIFFFFVWFIGWPIIFVLARKRADKGDSKLTIFTALGWTSWCLIIIGWVLAILNMALIIHAGVCIIYLAGGAFIGSAPSCPNDRAYYVNLVAALGWTSYISPILIVVGVAILIAHAIVGANWMKE